MVADWCFRVPEAHAFKVPEPAARHADQTRFILGRTVVNDTDRPEKSHYALVRDNE